MTENNEVKIYRQVSNTYFLFNYWAVFNNVAVNNYPINKFIGRLQRSKDESYAKGKIEINDMSIETLSTTHNCSFVFAKNCTINDPDLLNIMFRTLDYTILISNENILGNSEQIADNLYVYKLYGDVSFTYNNNPINRVLLDLGREIKISSRRSSKLSTETIGLTNIIQVFERPFLYAVSYNYIPIRDRGFFVDFSYKKEPYEEYGYKIVYEYTAYRTGNNLGVYVHE